MSLRHVTTVDGKPATLDDMPPATRAVLFLYEHGTSRERAGLPGPCPCAECVYLRQGLRWLSSDDGLVFTYTPAARP